MSAIGDAAKAIREVLKLTDDVKRAGETLKYLSRELREHDRRITRLKLSGTMPCSCRRSGGCPQGMRRDATPA